MKKIPAHQVVARIHTENPWWEPPHTIPPTFDDWTPRPYLDIFYPLAVDRSVRRAVVLMGPRRVGKTVMIHHAIRRLMDAGVSPNRIGYISVDHPLYNGLSLDELLKAYSDASGVDYRVEECYLFLDEIQYLRDWEKHLKAVIDRYPAAKCVASGSAAAALRLKSAESGAGRFTDFLLPPLTFHEYLELLGDHKTITIAEEHTAPFRDVPPSAMDRVNARFLDYLNFGGYPEVAFSKEIQQDPGRFVKSDIIDKVLLRDLPSLYGVHDVQELNYLFTTLAYNTAGEVSLEDLSQGSGVAKNTIKRYIEYLEAAFLIRVVHRVDRNARRFRRANFFKVYLTNPSIRSALFAPLGPQDDAMGAVVETAVFSQLFHSDMPFYYARWERGEVDIVSLTLDQRAAWAIEVKWSDRIVDRPRELTSLIQFCHSQNLEKATVTTKTRTETQKRQNVNVQFIPASLHCYVLGKLFVTARRVENWPF